MLRLYRVAIKSDSSLESSRSSRERKSSGRYPHRHAFDGIAFKRAASSALINPVHEGLA